MNELSALICLATDGAARAAAFLQTAPAREFIERTASQIALCFESGGKLIIAGNGGSLCDAAHIAEEFTGQFRKARRPLPAIALTEPGHITCTANDFGFDEVFSRGVEAFGKKEDIFIGLTTSGMSPNIVKAFEKARSLGLTTIAFTGKGGGLVSPLAHFELCVPFFRTSDRIQEAHMAAAHIIIEAVEAILFYPAESRYAHSV